MGYDWPNPEENYERAVGRACDTIRRQIREQGLAEHNLNRHLAWIHWLSRRVLSGGERAHLRAFDAPGNFVADVERSPNLKQELRRLAELGLATRKDTKTIESLFGNNKKGDVKDVLYISTIGQEYLKFYEQSKQI
jgi:hypothetical protein